MLKFSKQRTDLLLLLSRVGRRQTVDRDTASWPRPGGNLTVAMRSGRREGRRRRLQNEAHDRSLSYELQVIAILPSGSSRGLVTLPTTMPTERTPCTSTQSTPVPPNSYHAGQFILVLGSINNTH